MQDPSVLLGSFTVTMGVQRSRSREREQPGTWRFMATGGRRGHMSRFAASSRMVLRHKGRQNLHLARPSRATGSSKTLRLVAPVSAYRGEDSQNACAHALQRRCIEDVAREWRDDCLGSSISSSHARFG